MKKKKGFEKVLARKPERIYNVLSRPKPGAPLQVLLVRDFTGKW